MSKGPEIDAAAARKVADACSEFKLPKAPEVCLTGERLAGCWQQWQTRKLWAAAAGGKQHAFLLLGSSYSDQQHLSAYSCLE